MDSLSIFSAGYTVLWRIIKPFLRYSKSLRENFNQRLVPDDWGVKSDIWIQAASGGEAYLVLALLERIPAQANPLRIFLTTWTLQGKVVLEKTKARLETSRQDIVIQVQFFPLDEPPLMRQALEQIAPRVVVTLEAELWPGLLLACSEKNIPVLVLNGRIREKSLKGYDWLSRFFPGFWRSVAPRYVAAISSGDAARFAALFGEYRVGLVPNIKFDRAVPELETIDFSDTTLAAFFPDKPIILLSSVREEEEVVLLPVIKNLYARWRGEAYIVIAPRHQHRVRSWVEKLNSAKIPVRLRSRLGSNNAGSLGNGDLAVTVWDVFGELGKLYILAQAIFVGGSLVPLGGQNFLEPLSVGKIPCVGVHIDNFSWVFEPIFDEHEDNAESFAALIISCASSEDLEKALNYQLEFPQSVNEVKTRFDAWLEYRKGGAERCVGLLMALME